jgi:2-dehydropantoate 2-reductase
VNRPEAKILVVGAGAVGQAFAYWLIRGGAELTFLVKPKYTESMGAGQRVYPLNRTRWKGEDLGRYDVMDDLSEVAQQSWDQVWLCVASTALTESWLAELAGAIGSATLVSLTPGLEDKDRICRFVPEEQVVLGMIPFMSFQAPLPGSTRNVEPGVAWYVPPFSPTPFSGPSERRDWVIYALEQGGGQAASHVDVGRSTAAVAAVFQPYLIALELADWRFRTVRKHAALKLAQKAGEEALEVVRRFHGSAPRLPGLLNRPWVLKAVTYGGPWLPPYDLETFLRVHFSKVGSQTMAMLETWCERAEAADLPHDALDALRESLMEWRTRPGADT